MKYKVVIFGLDGRKEKLFESYNKAYEYGMSYVMEEDWTATFEVKEIRK